MPAKTVRFSELAFQGGPPRHGPLEAIFSDPVPSPCGLRHVREGDHDRCLQVYLIN